jgi:hypothetical protein
MRRLPPSPQEASAPGRGLTPETKTLRRVLDPAGAVSSETPGACCCCCCCGWCCCCGAASAAAAAPGGAVAREAMLLLRRLLWLLLFDHWCEKL